MEFKYVHKGDQLVFNNYYSIPEDPLLFISMAGRTTPRVSYRISRQDTFKQHFYVMEYVISGKGHIRYDGKEYSVGAGDFYLLNTVHTHSYYADEKEPFEKIWINVYGRLIDSLCQAFRFEPLLIRKVKSARAGKRTAAGGLAVATLYSGRGGRYTYEFLFPDGGYVGEAVCQVG